MAAQHGKGFKPKAFDDLFRFSIASNSWSRVEPVDGVTPSARSHHSLLSLSPRALLLYGGAICIPGCKCYGDTWVFDVKQSQWTSINASDAPIHRYRQSLVLNQQDRALYLFGGESYRPYMYHNAVDKLELSGDRLIRLQELAPSLVSEPLPSAPIALMATMPKQSSGASTSNVASWAALLKLIFVGVIVFLCAVGLAFQCAKRARSSSYQPVQQ